MNTYHQRFHPSEALTVNKKKVPFCNFPEHFLLHTKPPTALFWVSAVTKCGADLWRWWQPSLETAALQKRTPLMTFDKWWCLYPGQTSKLCTLRMHPSTSTHFLPRFALTFCICLLLCTLIVWFVILWKLHKSCPSIFILYRSHAAKFAGRCILPLTLH